MNKTFYNASGCKEPTAGKAIKFENTGGKENV